MTVPGLVSALIVGLVVGALGRLIIPGRQSIPIWLTLAIGVVAALLGTITARLAGVDTDAFSFRELLIQAGLAALGVVLVVATAGRGRSDSA